MGFMKKVIQKLDAFLARNDAHTTRIERATLQSHRSISIFNAAVFGVAIASNLYSATSSKTNPQPLQPAQTPQPPHLIILNLGAPVTSGKFYTQQIENVQAGTAEKTLSIGCKLELLELYNLRHLFMIKIEI